jgi:gliding motility-associated-like protein
MLKKLYILAFLLLSVAANAQEVCNDGIDNDGDGFIDCFDGECATSPVCDGSYTGNDATCEVIPSEFPDFTMTLDFSTPNETINHLGRMAIGDLDRDGIPEMISNNRYNDRIYILNGNDGTIKYSLNVDYDPRWEVAIANINDDDCAEIFLWGVKNNRNWIISYDCELNELWRVQVIGDPGNYGLADFDRDGKVELYLRNEIRDAETGTRIVHGNNWGDFNAGPVAVDIMDDEDLELVVGGIIYSVNLGNRTNGSGSLTERKRIPNYFRRTNDDATSVADFNLDGYLDILTTGSDGGKNQNTTVYFWDVQNDQVTKFIDKIPNLTLKLSCSNNAPNQYYTNGWVNGTGRINIADLDGDGQMNASFVSGRYLYALKEDFTLLWRVVINEETSGYTGCTLFDFNGDGSSEVVYRDEKFLYIINGATGTIYNQQACVSRTNREYPIVADVDADGSTEICVPCGFDDTASQNNFCDLGYSRYSHIRVFKSNSEPWVPARRLWNQHAYFNVNVNDDLSIPTNMQKHHLVWSTGNCTVGPNRPLNTFLNQSPFINSEGCPTFIAPDIAFIQTSLTASQPVCPERDFTLTFKIANVGDARLTGNVPISFYAGDPTQPGATYLQTEYFTVSSLDTGDSLDIPEMTITGPGSAFTLYMVLNDDGTTIPTPISLPNTDFLECDYFNNIETVDVDPLPFDLVTVATDNVLCFGSTAPPNGSARAYRLVGSTEETSDYIFDWFNGTDITGTPAYTGAVYSGLTAGTYTVIATHKTAGCTSAPAQVVINETPSDLSAEIVVERAYTNCKNPNGKLRVIADGGEPVGKYTYEWYVGNNTTTGEIISKSHIAADLLPIVYTVLVTEKATGCITVVSAEVPNEAETPVADIVVTDIICSDLNSGSVTASVSGSTNTADFAWYIGTAVKPSPDFTGSSVTGLPAGTYTLQTTDKNDKCTWDTTFVINQTVPPVIDNVTAIPQSACDPGLLNGSATVEFVGNPADYLIEWFTGQNTLAGNKLGEGVTLAGVGPGVYTVKLSDLATGCFDTAEVTVTQNIVVPQLTAIPTDATGCSPFDGLVTASVSIGDVADYTFSWYEGPAVKATPDFSETGPVLSSLEPGTYTVFAVNNVTGCEVVSSRTVTVNNNTPGIDITQIKVNEIPPSDCNSFGSLEVQISQAGNTQGFIVNWYEGNPPFTTTPLQTDTDVFTSTLTNISAGLYSVEAIDPVSGCSSISTFTLEFVSLHEITMNPIDATQCIPENGGLTLTLDTKGLDESDFRIEIYEGSNATGTPVQSINGVNGQTNYATALNFAVGEYTAVAINTANGFNNCRSIPRTAIIGSTATGPTLAVGPMADNTACEGSPFNGFAEIIIDGGAPAGNYTIEWFEGQNVSTSPVLGTNVGAVANGGLRAETLRGGVYAVRVTNSIGCENVIAVTIQNDIPILSVDVMPVHITACDMNGALTTGSASAQALDEGVPVAGYTYTWLDATNTPIGTGTNIANLSPGVYYITLSNAANGCGVTREFVINNETLNDPTIQLVAFENPTQCLQDMNLTGFLEIQVQGTSASGFDIVWRENDASGPVIAAGANQPRVDDLTNNANFSGSTKTYFIEAINRDTQCRTNEVYQMTREIVPVLLNATSTDVTSCDEMNPDGTLFATVTSGFSNNYSYDWLGTDGSVYNGKNVNGVVAGNYTITATDLSDAFCTADTTVSVLIDQIFPEIMTEILAGNLACEDSLSDGVARATVNGEYVGYTFEWYEGLDATGTPVYTGSEFFGMKATTYTVKAIDNISLCESLAQVTIPQINQVLPEITAFVLQDQTSCIEPNGIIAANVEGNTQDYIFNWYEGTQVTATADFTGEIWSSIPAGQYTVTATSKITGCLIGPATVEVQEILSYPEIQFVISSPSCDSENGFVEVVPMNSVEIGQIVWTAQDGMQYFGPNLSEVPAGTYEVTITSLLGCSITETVELIADIDAFNGISRNGDNRNDIFKIGCITDYPENEVKIFNRAGTLVYEIEGYDNATRFFDGTSNRGLSLLGQSLPDGTYYYVIDKKDGSKPIAGYLEIVQ